MRIDELKWKDILSDVSNEVTQVSFNTWFQPLIPLTMNEEKGTMYFAVKEDIIANIFSKNPRYVEILESSIRKYFNKNYKILIKVMTEDEISKAVNSEGKPETAAVSIDSDNPYKEEYYLNPKYTFDNFVIGPNNEYAHAVSLAVAENPGTAYNPLFIYGGSGLGKTHLMHAIGHEIMRKNPRLKVLYVSTEMFTGDLVKALQSAPAKRNVLVNAFKSKYRSVDVLLIDDIQFLEGKEQTQLEFFHTFNTLYGLNKQIVITSDRHPNRLRDLDERLTSRFMGNMMADIQPPDFETRVAILRKKAEEENVEIDEAFLDVIDLIAEKVKFNIRELESALTRVIGFSKFKKQKLNVKFAREHLTDIFTRKDEDISCESVKKAVCRKYNIKITDIESKKRNREFAFPRQIAMYLCRELTDLSFPKIGESFGGRDHTTVLHAYEKILKESKINESLAEDLRNLKDDIQ